MKKVQTMSEGNTKKREADPRGPALNHPGGGDCITCQCRMYELRWSDRPVRRLRSSTVHISLEPAQEADLKQRSEIASDYQSTGEELRERKRPTRPQKLSSLQSDRLEGQKALG